MSRHMSADEISKALFNRKHQVVEVLTAEGAMSTIQIAWWFRESRPLLAGCEMGSFLSTISEIQCDREGYWSISQKSAEVKV